MITHIPVRLSRPNIITFTQLFVFTPRTRNAIFPARHGITNFSCILLMKEIQVALCPSAKECLADIAYPYDNASRLPRHGFGHQSGIPMNQNWHIIFLFVW